MLKIFKNILNFYVEGFRNMTVGKWLWAMIIIKVIILMCILKPLFFPNILNRDYPDDTQRANAVRINLSK